MSEVQHELLTSTDTSQVGVVGVATPASGVGMVWQRWLVAIGKEPLREPPIRNARAIFRERAARCTFWFCPGRSLWISELHALCDVFQRNLGNGFARVWQCSGNPYRDPTFSSCCAFQRHVLWLAPVFPLR